MKKLVILATVALCGFAFSAPAHADDLPQAPIGIPATGQQIVFAGSPDAATAHCTFDAAVLGTVGVLSAPAVPFGIVFGC